MSENKIECPLCSGTGVSGDHQCPECKGIGRVDNVFAELRHGRYETAEETAAAECRPLADVQAEKAEAKTWIVCRTVADAWLSMTPAAFDDWLADQAAKHPGSDFELVRSGYLAGNLTEDWARDHASADVLNQ